MARRRALSRERLAERRTRRQGDPEVHAEDAKRRRNNSLRWNYGITHEVYDEMAAAQDGLCASCGRPPTGRGKMNFLVVDHCHATGKVRGLLCGNCNSAIGLLDDDPEVIRRAADYLTRSRVS